MARPPLPVDFEWVEVDGALGLLWKRLPRSKPLTVDFLSLQFRHRLKSDGGRRSLLARALGIEKTPRRILDGTCGFAQDAMVMAIQGCEVLALERSPVAVELCADGLRRAQADADFWSKVKGSLHIHAVDTELWLAKNSVSDLDVCYLDPMFALQKSALSSKGMQILQALDSHDAGSERALIQSAIAAFGHKKARVVVKRPRKAPPLHENVHHSIVGSVIRYDVYL
jgi:16S rRNA (guanine1516-N2)-methyltransferase